MRTNLEIGIAVTEATTIAEEIAVEIAVVAVLDAADFAVALTRRHIAADRTARADARRILHVPLARVALGLGLVGEHAGRTDLGEDRQRVVSGKGVSVRVDLGCRRNIKKKKKTNIKHIP